MKKKAGKRDEMSGNVDQNSPSFCLTFLSVASSNQFLFQLRCLEVIQDLANQVEMNYLPQLHFLQIHLSAFLIHLGRLSSHGMDTISQNN